MALPRKRIIRYRRVHCPVCSTLISNNALAREAHIRHCTGHPEKYVAQVSGSAFSRGPVAYFNTVTEAREWAESYGTTADDCIITDRSGRLVGSHRRDSNGDGSRWFRVTVGG